MCGLALMILCTGLMMAGWDRPIAAMHSWGHASGAIVARAHVHYGLGYTHGLSTWATGDPPPKQPQRYLDHPQGTALLHGAAMALFGVDDQALRKETLLATLLSVVILLQMLYYLLDSRLALMATLGYVLFPLTAYFGCRQWLTPVVFGALWYYLLCIGALRDHPAPQRRHYVLLGLMLFLAPQLNWSGFFYAAGIGVHYVLLCLIRRRWPSWLLLSVLAVCPLTAMAVNFLIMAAGYQWDTDKIMALYTWRASTGEMKTFEWQPWLARLWKHSRNNYTVAILAAAAVGNLMLCARWLRQQYIVWRSTPSGPASPWFPSVWLFVLPGLFQLFVLRGCLWYHQTWIQPFSAFVAVSAACGLYGLYRLMANRSLLLYNIVLSLWLCTVLYSTAAGLNHYHKIQYPPSLIRLFQTLQQQIPPDKPLVSYQSFLITQHPSKGPMPRPEVAWYLDRQIVEAQSLQAVEAQARTGAPIYLIPYIRQLEPLLIQLRHRYQWQYIPPDQVVPQSSSALPYMLFFLQKSATSHGDTP